MLQAKIQRPSIRHALAALAVSGSLLTLIGPGIAHAAAPIPPDGIWYTKDNESIIRVHACKETAEDFCGTLVWLKEPTESDGTPKVDKLNKDPAKKGQPMIGMEILLDMKSDEDHWTGKAYNPDDGKLYDITFHVKTASTENDTADLRGCVLGFLCQTESFTRAKDVPGGDPTLDAASPTPKKHKKAKKDTSAER